MPQKSQIKLFINWSNFYYIESCYFQNYSYIKLRIHRNDYSLSYQSLFTSSWYWLRLINKFKWSSLITMQRAGKSKALPSAFLTLNDAARQQVWKEGHVVNGSFNIVVRSAPLRYRRKWIAIPPAVAQPCVLHFLVYTTSRRHEHAGNISKKKNDAV